MKHDNASGAGVPFQPVQHRSSTLVSLGGVIPALHIPHHDLGMRSKTLGLSSCQFPVRGPEQPIGGACGLERGSGRVHIARRVRAPSVLVVHGVTSDGMAGISHALKQCALGLGVSSNDKKRGRHVALLQAGQHPRGDVRMGAIVKGQMHRLGSPSRPHGARPNGTQHWVGPPRQTRWPNHS